MEYLENLKKCNLCPHKCGVNRIDGNLGRCKAGSKVKIALANLHFFEEPCISGEKGSGTVFFSGCNLSCKFCQNYKISQEYLGKEIEIDELSKEFLKLQEMGANNINLVTGFMYIPQIIEALKIAKKDGLKIPVVYNSSGYESVEALKLLDGYIDVYLPDFKYFDNELAERLSGIKNYKENAILAIQEMYKQCGKLEINEETGMIKKGLIIRHLALPNYIENSKNVLSWIKENMPDVLVSVMAQYFPTHKAIGMEDIGRKLTKEEYETLENHVFDLNLDGFMQDLEDDETKYVPDFENA